MDKRLLNDLIERIKLGDEDSFTQFYDETNKGIFSFVYTFVKQKETAEDITQETFIKIRQNIQSYKYGTNPSAWFFQIAKNLALDYLKKYSKQTSIDITEIEIVDNKKNETDNKLFLHDMMNKYLSQEEREIFLLHVIHGYKHREIAKFMNQPLGTILWKYNTAKKILKQKIKEELKWKRI